MALFAVTEFDISQPQPPPGLLPLVAPPPTFFQSTHALTKMRYVEIYGKTKQNEYDKTIHFI